MIFTHPNQLNQALKASSRLMAIDVGTKRIGIALSDESRFLATPKLVLQRQSNEKDFAKLRDFITEHKVAGIIIGLPLTMEGNSQPMTEFAQKFAKNFDEFLEEKFPILLFEERLTSFQAREIHNSGLSRKKNKFVDDIAASFILQHFLDEFKGSF